MVIARILSSVGFGIILDQSQTRKLKWQYEPMIRQVNISGDKCYSITSHVIDRICRSYVSQEQYARIP